MNIMRRRVERGLSRPELAEYSKTSLVFLHKLERAQAVSLKTICNVAEYLEMTAEDLLRIPEADSRDQSILEEVLK